MQKTETLFGNIVQLYQLTSVVFIRAFYSSSVLLKRNVRR